jgi:hypothetical protein
VSVPQVPESANELEAMIAGGILVEGLGFDAKAMLEPGERGNRSLAIDLAAMSVAGGLIAIGVGEEAGRLVLAPIPLAGLRERISQVGRSRIDPPVVVTTGELAVDDGRGYLSSSFRRARRPRTWSKAPTAAAATPRTTSWATPRFGGSISNAGRAGLTYGPRCSSSSTTSGPGSPAIRLAAHRRGHASVESRHSMPQSGRWSIGSTWLQDWPRC